jgi:dGTPase
VHAEPPPTGRDEFQRDRDRIIHSTAFRRLEYKTQVFVNHEGDLFRTRLTHSLEVAQIARSIARNLGLNEALTEAISLAHDLGHTPFGHAGQDALNACMAEHGGFEHNLQSLRVVDLLEERYADFDGLNLTFETREGILKHCSRRNAEQLGPIGERFLRGEQPSLEAQLANVADELAYNNHDVDDGLRSGLITLEQLEQVGIFARHIAEVRARYPGLAGRRLIHETIRRMINTLVVDLTNESRRLIAGHAPASIDAVRLSPPMIALAFAGSAKIRSGAPKSQSARAFAARRRKRSSTPSAVSPLIGRAFRRANCLDNQTDPCNHLGAPVVAHGRPRGDRSPAGPPSRP